MCQRDINSNCINCEEMVSPKRMTLKYKLQIISEYAIKYSKLYLRFDCQGNIDLIKDL